MEKQSVTRRLRLKARARRTMRRALPFVASLFLATPMATPVSSLQARAKVSPLTAATLKPIQKVPLTTLFEQGAQQLYNELGVAESGLRFEVFEKAYTGYLNLKAQDKLNHQREILTVIDFEKPSTEKRLWVLDLNQKTVLFNTLVAHGHNSGENVATTFSNKNESNMSSLGFYVTDAEYVGKHGRSLKLQGVDKGFNDNAMMRAVVMHGAEYVSEDFIRQYGRLGRSLGCPALPMEQHAQIIEAVGGRTCMFLNGPDAAYESSFLDSDVAAREYVSAGDGSSV